MATTVEIRDQLAALIGELDPAVVPGPSAAAMVSELSAIEKLAQSGRVLLARRVAESRAWAGSGERSAADWLARQAGTSVSEAAGVLETSKQVCQLEGTASALRSGKLSAGQAKAVAHAASADPAAEAELLEVARTETFQGLRSRSAAVAAAATDDVCRQRRIRARRSLRNGIDADGAHWLTVRGPAADGVAIHALLKPFQEQAFRAVAPSGERPTFENRSYDAFMAMVGLLRRDLGMDSVPDQPSPNGTAPSDALDATDGQPGAGPFPPAGSESLRRCDAAAAEGATNPPSRVPRLPGGNNTKVIVLIDHTALMRGRTVAGETCEVAGLGPVPATVVRELLPDAFVAAVVKKGHDVVNVAHLGRGVNAFQRTAIDARGLRCSNIACNQTVALQIDHRVPWVVDQVTELDNQDPLCPDCHRRKTHHGWRLASGTGRRPFVGPRVEGHQSSASAGDDADPADADEGAPRNGRPRPVLVGAAAGERVTSPPSPRLFDG